MLTAYVVKRANHAAFEDTDEALNRICMGIAVNVLFCGALDGFMACELFADRLVKAQFIGHQISVSGDLFG